MGASARALVDGMAGCGRTHRVPVPRWSGRPPATFAGARLQIDASSLDELIVEFAALTGAVAPSQLFPVCVWWSVSLPFVCPMGRTLAWMRASVCVCVHALLTEGAGGACPEVAGRSAGCSHSCGPGGVQMWGVCV